MPKTPRNQSWQAASLSWRRCRWFGGSGCVSCVCACMCVWGGGQVEVLPVGGWVGGQVEATQESLRLPPCKPL